MKVIVFDLDGTLTQHKTPLDDTNYAVLKKLMRNHTLLMVGAGDCMVAAACVGLKKGVPMRELLRMSVAAGTASVTTSGTNLFYYDKYKEIYAKINSEKIYFN